MDPSAATLRPVPAHVPAGRPLPPSADDRPPPTTLKLMFTLGGPILPTVTLRVGVMAATPAAVAGLHHLTPHLLRDVGPAPFTCTLLLHRTAWPFCLLPFGGVGTLDGATPVLAAILACAFFRPGALGQELEQPFSTASTALPLDATVRAVEIVTGQALGDPELPDALQARDFVLL